MDMADKLEDVRNLVQDQKKTMRKSCLLLCIHNVSLFILTPCIFYNCIEINVEVGGQGF